MRFSFQKLYFTLYRRSNYTSILVFFEMSLFLFESETRLRYLVNVMD